MQVLSTYQALSVPTSNPKSTGFIVKMSPFFSMMNVRACITNLPSGRLNPEIVAIKQGQTGFDFRIARNEC